MCDAITVAKYIISRCAEDNEPVSNLQLQYSISMKTK